MIPSEFDLQLNIRNELKSIIKNVREQLHSNREAMSVSSGIVFDCTTTFRATLKDGIWVDQTKREYKHLLDVDEEEWVLHKIRQTLKSLELERRDKINRVDLALSKIKKYFQKEGK